MADLDRLVAGLRCREVLARLGDYVDGELPPAERTRVEDHLRGCDHCEKFGGEYEGLVARLRASLSREVPDPGFRARLAGALERAWSSGDG